MNENKNYGLQLLPKDKNDFSLGKIISYPSLVGLPDNFEYQPFKIKDQLGSDYCSAFSSTSASELQEGVELSPEFSFAMGQKLSKSDWGQNLRVTMQAHTKIGCIEQKDAPFSLDNKDDKFLRNPDNWTEELQIKALIHAKSSFVDCKGPFDAFDNLKSAIWSFRNERRAIILGVLWENWDIKNPMLENGSGGQFGHAMCAIGFCTIKAKQYIVLQNSYGAEVGDNGKFYIPREVINKYVPIYGAYMFLDMSPEEYQQRLKDYAQNWILRALKKILEILGILNKQKYLPPEPTPEPVPIVEPPKVSLLTEFALAIKVFEGWFNGSRSQRNLNPGNLKYTSLTKFLGATGKDKDNFCIFPNYITGFGALCQFITLAAENKLKDYHDKDIYGFFEAYAPSWDKNLPSHYAEVVARKIGVLPTTKLKVII